jgi:hypothetical protein
VSKQPVTAPGGATSDSGTLYTYTTSSGTTLTQTRPPADFDPSTASAADLDFYGIPTEPADTADQGSWMTMVNNYTGFAAPGGCTPAVSVIDQLNTTKSNWAGEVAQNAYYTGVQSNFVLPTDNNNCPSGDMTSDALWVGLSGYSSGTVIQNGASDDWVYPGDNEWYWWWELYSASDNQRQAVDGSMSPGDNIVAKTTYSETTGKATFYWDNYWLGSMNSVVVSGAGNYWGTGAEAIQEREGYKQNNVSYLSDLRRWTSGAVQFASTKVYDPSTSAWTLLRGEPNTSIDMQSGNDVLDTTVNGTGNGAFSTRWGACK